jgi:hypothetical protein
MSKYMAIATFDDFCDSICDLIGVAAPTLEPDASGLVGFTVTHHETAISFLKADRGDEPGILMMVDFGAPPADKAPAVMLSLLDANFLMMGVGAPSFGRNPATGEISLQQSFLLSQVDVRNIYQGIANAADTVATWRKTNFHDESPLPHHMLEGAGVSLTDLR